MDIVSIGGGPAGLYFSILMKLRDARHCIRVIERNGADDTFGWGVVFSDETLGNLATADPETYREITESFAHWDAIDIHYQGEVLTSRGHGFSGLSRRRLLNILQGRAEALGVELEYRREVASAREFAGTDLVLAADGANSVIRQAHADAFGPELDWRPNKFIWLGTTRKFDAFTFYFKLDAHGLWRVHAYRFDDRHSTFIVETTAETWKRAGLDHANEDQSVRFLEALFAAELDGHPLLKNKAIWRNFPTVRNRRWSNGNIVLLGDAAHTAHFSVGSGTKLAMEDSIALADALAKEREVPTALAAYEAERRPQVESLQRAAQASLEWFESAERYHGHLEPIEFAASLLTRSLRITHENLKVRDPAFVARIDGWFARKSANQSGINVPAEPPPPPMFTPFRLRDLVLENRVVVSPMCQYSAEDGLIDDWHLVHLGSRAVGGAGLVVAEMTDVSREGRISPGCAGLYKPEHIRAWKRVVDFVHENSRAKIGIQLAHAGRKGSTRKLWEGIDEPLPDGNWPLISASPLPYLAHSQVPRPMDRTEMEQVRDDFVRAVWPGHKPMSVRVSGTDWMPGGFDGVDAVGVAKALKARQCDIVDVSAGQTVPDQKPHYGRLFQTPYSDRVRREAEIPTMTVGAISTWADVNSILVAGRADLCVLARAHLYDPYWTRHAAQEQGYVLPWPDQYSSLAQYQPRMR